MGMDGTYGFVYCGNRGVGIGVFSINGGHIEGRDFAGSSYEGTATQDGDGNVVLDAQIKVPAGVVLVQGTAPQDLPHARQISWTFPPAFGDGEPQMVEFGGPVTVMVKRIPDENAAIVKNGFTDKAAARMGGFIVPQR
jgi:hypothetical protein